MYNVTQNSQHNVTQIPQTTPPKFVSPLKENAKAPRRGLLKPRKLLGSLNQSDNNKDKVIDELTHSELSKIYLIDFEKIGIHTNSIQFFAIRDQLFIIENFLRTHLVHDPELIRPRILKQILKDIDFKHGLKDDVYKGIMAELGMILFYLDRDKALPYAESLVAYRAKQIDTEVQDYLKTHTETCKNPLVPSGKTHYLMRAFSHMLLTTGQEYNFGGLIALQQLLKNPAYSTALHLEPEHHEHILAIVAKILLNPAFEQLFQKKVTIHPDLQEVIRIDLKLPPHDKIHSVHVMYDCLMALFSDVRQENDPNCYAIGTLIYVSENHTFKTLSTLVQWLEHGHYAFNQTTTIPIKPLLEKRLTYSCDLDIKLENNQALDLAPFEHISQTLSLSREEVQSEVAPLGKTLSSMLRANEVSHQLLYAEKLYYAYKYNTLNHMQLAIIEFAVMNSRSTLSSSSPFSKEKQKFLDCCLRTVMKEANIRLPSQFVSLIQEKLGEALWLESCNLKNVKIRNRTISTEDQIIKGFKGNTEALAEALRRSLRIFYLKDGQYNPLLSISDLQKTLATLIEEVIEEHAPSINKSTLIKAVHSWNFRFAISNFAASQIAHSGIHGKHLNWTDLLVLQQKGGWGEVGLETVYGIRGSSQEVKGGHTPYQFLSKLQSALQKMDKRCFVHASKILIASCHHEWSLSPSCWKPLLENAQNHYTFMEKNFFEPAKKMLASPIPESVVERIASRYTTNGWEKEDMIEFLKKEKLLTYGKCRDLLLLNKYSFKKNKMKRIIEEEFSKITLNENELHWILIRLDLKITDSKIEKILNKINETPLLPHQSALCFRTALIEENLAVDVDVHEIERTLRKVKKLPVAIPLGDLNYMEDYSEDPAHIHLSIEFSWVSAIPLYFNRSKSDYFLSRLNGKSESETFSLIIPK